MDTPTPGWAPGPVLRVYAAENAAAIDCPAPTIPELDGTLEGAQHWIDKITRSAWWRRTAAPSWRGDNTGHHRITGPPRRIICRHTTGRCSYAYTSHVHLHRGRWYPLIALTAVHRTAPWIILHEIAHIMAVPVAEANSSKAHHGRDFAHCLHALVHRWLGPDAARALRTEYRAHGIKYRARRAACQAGQSPPEGHP